MIRPNENQIVDLWSLPEDRVYIKFKQRFRKYFFEISATKAGNRSQLARFLKIKSVSNLYSYENGRYFFPIKKLRKILKLFGKNEINIIIQMIEENIIAIKTMGNSKPIENPKFPIIFSPLMAELSGHIVGDGGIFNLNGTYIAHYSNTSRFLIAKIERNVKNIFGRTEIYNYHDKRKNAWRLYFPSVIGLILFKFLGNQNGKDKHIPHILFDSEKSKKVLFLRSLFDDEGTVNHGTNDGSGRSISIGMQNKAIIEKVKIMLREFDISCGKTGKSVNPKSFKIDYDFAITSRDNLEKFKRNISFSHPEKRKKLNKVLASYKRPLKIYYAE